MYYALLHAVSGALVEPLQEMSEAPGFKDVFVSLYRKPEHSRIERRSKEVLRDPNVNPCFKRFAQQLTSMRNKREAADYDPLAQMELGSIARDFQQVETVLKEFWEADAVSRVGFAVFLTANSHARTSSS